MMMGYRTLYILLWVMPACIHTTKEPVSLIVSPVVMAQCNQQVTLHCNVSSTRHHLSIRNLSWIQNENRLCDIDSAGKVVEHHGHTQSGFRCRYEQGQLSLIFEKVKPLESGTSVKYMCKLRSNVGVAKEYTTVELQECCGNVDAVVTPKGPTCTFTRVHPGGDVHWFHGSTKLADGSLKTNTSKSVDAGGWLTITSSLEKKDNKKHYNCSLWSPKSRRYIASSLVQDAHPVKSGAEAGAGAQGPLRILFCFTLLATLLMK
ncbi:uncharacterized protein LOC115368740 [Myripristis murdjan]|uniref:uncharacterized protein LOC115368740 n=1 Tax=Myripristis murdjan TaxID=586833 RepID=UPI00117604B4|nr:uncharacterized protein LOC115368740 [Myripristis murdjan]